MSHIQHRKFAPVVFEFDNKIYRKKLIDNELKQNLDLNPKYIKRYENCIRICNCVEFNCKGLLENIYYINKLIQKGKFNISIDIYLEHIIKHLLENINFNYINEFCLLKENVSNGDMKYIDKNLFYNNGIEYLINITNYINWFEKTCEINFYNTNRKTILEGADWDNIMDNVDNYEMVCNGIVNNQTFHFGPCWRFTDYRIKKICNKIIKMNVNWGAGWGYKKQIKKSEIQEIIIVNGEPKKLPDIPYTIRENSFNDIVYDDMSQSYYFCKFCKNKKYILDTEKLVEHIKYDKFMWTKFQTY